MEGGFKKKEKLALCISVYTRLSPILGGKIMILILQNLNVYVVSVYGIEFGCFFFVSEEK